MRIQSLSVVVPAKACINNCKFCVSRMRLHQDEEDYPNLIERDFSNPGHLTKMYVDRMQFARDNGCNTVMLTGISEPQQNLNFLFEFANMNRDLSSPFKIIEMQTTGAGITREDLFALSHDVGINTISLSLSSFDSDTNAQINGTTSANKVDLEAFARSVKEAGMLLRLSVNLTNEFDVYEDRPWQFFKECKYVFRADQVTLRQLYAEPDTPQGQWVESNGASPKTVYALEQYIVQFGKELEKLEFGRTKYSIMGMGIVLDNDCMAKEQGKNALKYAILRPNCRLYSRWDDTGSLIF